MRNNCNCHCWGLPGFLLSLRLKKRLHVVSKMPILQEEQNLSKSAAAPSQLWLAVPFAVLLTFLTEPMWPDAVGWFYILSNTSVWGTGKTGRLPGSVNSSDRSSLLLYFFRGILAEGDTRLAVGRENPGLHKQHYPASSWTIWRSELKGTGWSEQRGHWGQGSVLKLRLAPDLGREGPMQEQQMPVKALIRKVITLVLILYLWFMELTAVLTRAFHYFWLVALRFRLASQMWQKAAQSKSF